jgi:hypothetical protein
MLAVYTPMMRHQENPLRVSPTFFHPIALTPCYTSDKGVQAGKARRRANSSTHKKGSARPRARCASPKIIKTRRRAEAVFGRTELARRRANTIFSKTGQTRRRAKPIRTKSNPARRRARTTLRYAACASGPSGPPCRPLVVESSFTRC